MKAKSGRKAAPHEWWRTFFTPVVGEIMFVPKGAVTDVEVAQVIKQSKARNSGAVLDLACGVGRHSLSFAQRGFSVTGLDYSEPYLRDARKAAKKKGLDIRFVHGDMCKLTSHFEPNEFGLVVSLYNSFGYFGNRSDDRRMLRAVHRVLKPGGAFVLNTLNQGGVARRLKSPVSRGSEPFPNVFMIDAARYDVHKKQTICEWTIVDARSAKAKVHRHPFRQNVYSHAELKRMLRDIGFKIEKTWGMLPGGRFDPARTWHQTIVARKPA